MVLQGFLVSWGLCVSRKGLTRNACNSVQQCCFSWCRNLAADRENNAPPQRHRPRVRVRGVQ